MKVLLPPGIGDTHWVLLKLRSFMDRYGDGHIPEVWIWDDGRPRVLDYLRQVPMVTVGGVTTPRGKNHTETWQALFVDGSQSFVDDLEGFDFALGFNGMLEKGIPLPEILPECVIEWDYPVVVEPCSRERTYIVASVFGHGFYQDWWLPHLTPKKIASLLGRIHSEVCPVVLTGASWDRDFALGLDARCEDRVGKTTVRELISLIWGASCFIGFAAGNGLLAHHLRVPTILFWARNYTRFPQALRESWARPGTLDLSYVPLFVEDYDEDDTIACLEDLTGLTCGGDDS